MAEGKRKREHVIILSFMADSHIMPTLALALDLETRRNCLITIINTPQNIEKVKSWVPAESTANIRLRSIPFNSSDHGLPPNTENASSLPYSLVFRLMASTFSLEPALRDLLSEIVQEDGHKDEERPRGPLCIISDIFFAWSAKLAHEFGMFHAIFAVTCGFGWACYYSLWSNISHWKAKLSLANSIDDDQNNFIIMEDFLEGGKIEIDQMPASMIAANGKTDDEWSVFQRKMLSEYFNSDGFLFNTVEEIDRLGLDYFKRKTGKPAWGIGPILCQLGRNHLHHQKKSSSSSSSSECGGKGITIPSYSKSDIKEWLDSKPARSVLYVSFGTLNTLTRSQMMEMAKGLEASGKFFIWVVKPPVGAEFEALGDDWLPPGFHEKVVGRGLLIVRGWAPQLEILSHQSTGGFISQCGWNSVLEAIGNAVPIVGWPMAGEQFFSVKLLEQELGVCVELARGNGCEVRWEDIVKKVEIVMGDNQEAKEMRRRVSEVKKIMENARKEAGDGEAGSSIRAMDEFLKMAIARRDQKMTMAEL